LFHAMGSSTLGVRFEVNVVKVSHVWLFSPSELYWNIYLTLGSFPSASWHSVQTYRWRRVAIPNVGETGIDRTQAITSPQVSRKRVT
jgi:hypothetical protein